MSEPSLKQRTIGALLWNLLDRMGQQVLLFIVGVLVANILSVEDYALVGMLAIFSAIANIVLDSGFSAALIRKQDATETDYNSVFYFNIFISACLYLLLFVCSPLIAGFFNQPLLTDLARVIFLALPFNSLSLIQTTLLNKQVSFKILTKINLIALTASGIGSLAMAYGGMGVWTLAWQPVILAFLRTVLLWFFNKWRPQLLFSISHIKELFGFSSNLLLAGLVNSIFTNIYSVAIGKLYPPVQLGYYSQGNKFSLMVISSVYSSLQTATYPIFSHIQNDKERSLRSYRKTIRFTAFLTFPLMTGMVSVAYPFIALILKAEEGDHYWQTGHSDGTKDFVLTLRSKSLFEEQDDNPKDVLSKSDEGSSVEEHDDVSKNAEDISRKKKSHKTGICMDGQEVFKFAARMVPKSINKVLDEAGVSKEEIKYFVLHQANKRIIEAAARRLKQPIEKFPMNIDRCANTSSATIPILLDEINQKGMLNRGDKIVLSGFGGGLTWGSVYLTW